MNVLILIGFPGSGKSFYAKSLPGINKIVSSDQYFTDEKGNYNWTINEAHKGHQYCLRNFIETIINDEIWRFNYLIVDNTNLRIQDISSYIRIAQAYECKIQVKYIDTDINIAKARNVHGVPDATYDKMKSDFENLLSVWPKDFPHIEYVKQ